MLKISEMAKLANTTRRTLIYYDEEGIFKPAQRTEAGYRYYEHDQLYELMRILGLRNLGISLHDIKMIKQDSKQNAELTQLLNSRAQLDRQIRKLLHLQKIIDDNIQEQQSGRSIDEHELYQVKVISDQLPTTFWVSSKASDCSEEEIAHLFAAFYRDLDSLAIMNTGQSGYLTDLSVNDPEAYIQASFRVIKETTNLTKQNFIPVITKAVGQYVSVLVESDEESVIRGLKLIRDYCQQHNLKVQDHLWQINTSNELTRLGASKFSWLEYAIIE